MPEEVKVFRCQVCGYEYETTEEELPEDFVCPMCGVDRDNFILVD